MNYVAIFESTDRRLCNEMRLVINAAGMQAVVSSESGLWTLLVDEPFADAASAELAAYEQDKAEQSEVRPLEDFHSLGGTMEGVFGYALCCILVAFLAWNTTIGQDLEEAGHLNAGLVRAGEWWRTFTALTLHLDFAHLLSNLVFGAIFGFFVGQLLGGGVAWLFILLGGAGGNFANALIRDSAHQSIGASTAVFAALGIVVAFAIRPSLRAKQTTVKRWGPLIAGLLLLGLLGTGGDRTDVTAHVAGFFSGLGFGWCATLLPYRWLEDARVQWGAGTIALCILVAAWLTGGWLQN